MTAELHRLANGLSVALDPLPGVRPEAPVYPPGEDSVFGELKELVKVYQRPFRIRQTLVVRRPAAKPGAEHPRKAGPAGGGLHQTLYERTHRYASGRVATGAGAAVEAAKPPEPSM